MRNELIDKFDASRPDGDLIKVVMDNSKEEALQRYERPFYDMQNGSGSMGWYKMLCRTPALFNRSQFAVFRAVHQWRDTIARQEDESVHQVIPKHVLYNIARELPTDMPSLLGCSHPMSKSFQKRKGELLGVIRQAKASGATGPEMSDFMQTISPLYSDRMMKASGGGKVSTTSTVADKDALPPPQITESGLPGKTDSSRFWGPNVKRNATTRRLPLIRMRHESLRLALPLPQLTAEVFEDLKTTEQGPTETAQTNLGARAEHQYVKDRKRKEDDVFVIKQASGSRKRKVTELDGHPELISPYSNGESVAEGVLTKDDGMEISSSIAKAEGSMTITGMPRLTREQKQERRQEEKRLEKEKSLQEGGVPDSKRLGEVQAFDYANAPSVLQAKQTDNDRAVASKSVNPYVKSLDAPKVMRKSYPKKEIGGKSFTFKS
ncbi:exosome nuclease subunit [Mycoblastus sanguinarius]|nr:exosome nuclease subunit [Mycoblastus sanguinarius]